MDLQLRYTFEVNGKTYRTNEETIKVLRSIAPQSVDGSAILAVIILGTMTGEVIEVK